MIIRYRTLSEKAFVLHNCISELIVRAASLRHALPLNLENETTEIANRIHVMATAINSSSRLNALTDDITFITHSSFVETTRCN